MKYLYRNFFPVNGVVNKTNKMIIYSFQLSENDGYSVFDNNGIDYNKNYYMLDTKDLELHLKRLYLKVSFKDNYTELKQLNLNNTIKHIKNPLKKLGLKNFNNIVEKYSCKIGVVNTSRVYLLMYPLMYIERTVIDSNSNINVKYTGYLHVYPKSKLSTGDTIFEKIMYN